MTTDRGVKDLLSRLIARDTMHQNQWIAAIKELEASVIRYLLMFFGRACSLERLFPL
jgi:Mn-containing catalase